MKLPRIQNVPQFDPVEASLISQMLEGDNPEELPILPHRSVAHFLFN
jgi:hypothetical protein